MSKFTKEMVNDYAEKLLIGLTEEENAFVLSEFDIIDQNMELLNTIPDLKNVEPMTHALDNFTYELRDDEVEESVRIEEILQNCDVHEGREVKVPIVVGGEQ